MADMYMRDIKAWREATVMLSYEEKGYFDDLLNLIYLYDDQLLDDDDLLCRLLPCNKKIHLRLKRKLFKLGLISFRNGFIHNSRSTREIYKINSISAKNKVKSAKRWAKYQKIKDLNNASADADADADGEPDEDAGADADGILNSEEGIVKKDNNKLLSKKNAKLMQGDEDEKELTDISTHFKPTSKVPDIWDKYARQRGIENVQSVFTKWIKWWISEGRKKAGLKGWAITWELWIDELVEREADKGGIEKKQISDSLPANITGAGIALNRIRAKQGEVE